MRTPSLRPTIALAAVAVIVLALGGATWAQPGSIQVVADPGLAVRVDGEAAGVTAPDTDGVRIDAVRAGDRRVEAVEGDVVIWDDVVPVLPGRVTFVRPVDAWPIQFGTDAIERVEALTVEAAGQVIVAGYVEGSVEGSSATFDDAFVRAFGLDGGVLWTRPFGTPDWDRATALAEGPDGTLFVAGWTSPTLFGNLVGFVRALDGQGNEVWTHRFGTDAEDRVNAIAVGPEGTVFVAGSTQGSFAAEGAGESDGFVRALDAGGNELWTSQFGTAAWDEVDAVAVDAAGNPIVAGRTRGSLGGTNAGSWDAFVQALDGTGELLWSQRIGTEAGDHAQALAVGLDGTIFVAGRTEGSMVGSGGGANDGFVRALDEQGRERWTHAFATDADDGADAVAVGSDGTVYVAGRTERSGGQSGGASDDGLVRALDAQGGVLWTHRFGTTASDAAAGVAVAPDGSVFVGGTTVGVFDGFEDGYFDGFIYRVPFRVE